MSNPAPPSPDRFNPAPRAALRHPPRWHPLSYIGRHLPATIAELVPLLGVGPGDRVLDYGCAERPYRPQIPSDAEYVGADLPGNPDADVEIAADGTVPVADASFDAVLSTQVLEHVPDPAVYLSECARVLRPGGRILLSTHGIMVFHPDPVDLWRWTCAGLERSAGDAGFEVERLDGVMGLGATGIQLFQEALLARLPRPLRPVAALPLQLLVALADRFLDTTPSRALNALVFVMVARKPEARA